MGCALSCLRCCGCGRHQQETEMVWEGNSNTEPNSMAPMEVQTKEVQKSHCPPVYQTTITSPVPVKIAIQPRHQSIEIRQDHEETLHTDFQVFSRERRNTHPYNHHRKTLQRTGAGIENVKNRRLSEKDIKLNRPGSLKGKKDLSKSSSVPIPCSVHWKNGDGNAITSSDNMTENEEADKGREENEEKIEAAP